MTAHGNGTGRRVARRAGTLSSSLTCPTSAAPSRAKRCSPSANGVTPPQRKIWPPCSWSAAWSCAERAELPALCCLRTGCSSRVIEKLREKLLKAETWNLLARLGPGAFETISGEVVKAALLTLSRCKTRNGSPRGTMYGMDVSEFRTTSEKAVRLAEAEIKGIEQARQLENPDARISLRPLDTSGWLSEIADYGKGSTTGDGLRFLMYFWEFPLIKSPMFFWLNSPTAGGSWSGRNQVCKVGLDSHDLTSQFGCRIHGNSVWKRSGVAVNKCGSRAVYLCRGSIR